MQGDGIKALRQEPAPKNKIRKQKEARPDCFRNSEQEKHENFTEREVLYKIDKKKRKKSNPDANALLGTEEGYEAFRQKEALILKPGEWEDPIPELADNTTESKSKKGTEEAIEHLGKEVKRDLNSKKLGKPEGQFEKIRIKRQPDGAINNAQPSRYLIGIGQRQNLETIHQGSGSQEHEQRLAKNQLSKDWVYECTKRKEFYQRTLVAKDWEELDEERTHSNTKEEEFHEHSLVRIT